MCVLAGSAIGIVIVAAAGTVEDVTNLIPSVVGAGGGGGGGT